MIYMQRLSSYQQENIYQYLSEYKTIYTCNESECRRFTEAVFWMAKNGSQQRLLPKEYGAWNTVYRRFVNWADKGIWYKMLYCFAKNYDMEYIMIDSTILRVHACAAVKKTNKPMKPQGEVVVVFPRKFMAYAMLLATRQNLSYHLGKHQIILKQSSLQRILSQALSWSTKDMIQAL